MQGVNRVALALAALAVVAGLMYFSYERGRSDGDAVAAARARETPSDVAVVRREETAPQDERSAKSADSSDEPRLDAPATTPRAHVRGTLHEQVSRLGIADFTLLVDDGEREPEAITTRADGSFESAREYEAGELSIELLDRARTQSLQFYDGGLAQAWPPRIERAQWTLGAQIDLAVATGPMLTVSLASRSTLPDGGWFGAVYDRSPCGRNTTIGCERAPLRTGATTWMRCAARAIDPSAKHGDLTLIVSSADGLMAGSVATAGFGDVAVELAPTARLDLDLVRHDDLAIEMPQVEVRATKSGCVRRADSRWNGSDVTDGAHSNRYVFGALEPGEYEFTASCRGCSSDRQRVRLRGGKSAHFTILLAPRAGEAYLRGELRSVSTKFATPVIVRVTPDNWSDNRPLTQRCEFQDVGGESVARFEFTGLQPNSFWIQVIPEGNERPRWTPQSIRVHAPSDELVFTCRDDEPHVTVRVRALDADTDDPLDDANWEYSLDGVEMTSKGKELVLDSVSTESQFEWHVTSRGYGISSGNWKQIWHGGKESFGEARLQRGWGAKVRVVNESSRVPLADATVVVDREEVGHTDTSGVLLVDRRRVPRWIAAKLDGWEQVDDMRKLGVVVDESVFNVLVLPMRDVR
jgi:hypothetical protein